MSGLNPVIGEEKMLNQREYTECNLNVDVVVGLFW